MAEELGERTEQATPKRLQDAREEGNVARSNDLSSALMLGASALALWFGFGPMLDRLGNAMERVLSEPGLRNVAPGTWQDSVEAVVLAAVFALAPIAIAIWFAGVAANLVQVGFLVTPKALAPKVSKLNPIEGAKRIFGSRALVKAILDSLKVLLVVVVVAWTVHGMHDRVMLLPLMHLPAAMMAVGELMVELALRVAAVLLLLGVIDFTWQKHKHAKDMMMSRQQIKDEFKQSEGDPEVKRRRLQFARQIAQQRIASAVPKADVIVTNPEHLSVAIQWDESTMRAPIVVAMGADHLALRIRQIAMQHGIPILERKPLARALYKQVTVGQEIPVETYEAVSEVLTYVYQLNGKVAV